MADLRVEEPWIGEPIHGGFGVIPLRRPYARFTAPGLTDARADTVDVAVGTFDDVQGSWDRLGPGTVAVQRIEAESRGYALGDTVDMTIGAETHPVEIVAIFDYAGQVSDSQSYYLDYGWVSSFQASPRDFTVAVTLAVPSKRRRQEPR